MINGDLVVVQHLNHLVKVVRGNIKGEVAGAGKGLARILIWRQKVGLGEQVQDGAIRELESADPTYSN